MGRRRDKTKWSQLHWQESGHPVDRRHRSTSNPRKRRNSSIVAPRFTKNLGHNSVIPHHQDPECSIEELPDGYTKIRSKNLDILFKREYYEKKLMALRNFHDHCSSGSFKEAASVTDDNVADAADVESSTPQPRVNFEELDIDEIPEFRPRQGTLESINDSGYSGSFQDSFLNDQSINQSPGIPPYMYPAIPQPHLVPPPIPMSVPPPQHLSQFYLYSPMSNTLIPCEEVVVAQTLENQEGHVHQNQIKAYVAYPVQGPDGRGYITQPFAPPPSYGSGSDDNSAKEDQEDHVVEQESYGINDTCSNDNKDVNDVPFPMAEETSSKPVNVSASSVYIPGLPPTEKRTKKKRKKRSKATPNNVKTPSSLSSSESETKEIVCFIPSKEEDLSTFIAEEPINEINLTDDLTNSIINPPTDDDIESSEIAKEIMHLVESEDESKYEDQIESVEDTKPKHNETNPAEINGHFNKKNLRRSKPKSKIKSKCKNENLVISTEEISPNVEDEPNPVTRVEMVIPCPGEEEDIDLNEGVKVCQDIPESEVVPVPDDTEVLDDTENAKDVLVTKPAHRMRKKRRGKMKSTEISHMKRVIVVDDNYDQVNIRYCTTKQLDHHNNNEEKSDCCPYSNVHDLIMVRELGHGMLRGALDIGRLRQGDYIPPDRRDFSSLASIVPTNVEDMEYEQFPDVD